MKRNKLLAAAGLSFALFCISLVWKTWEDEKNTNTIYVTHNEPTEEALSETSNVIGTETSISTIESTSLYTITTEITTLNAPLYIDLNTADAQSLCLLEGIGEKLSEEIVRYREEHGKFNNIEEIMNVHGIGEKIFAGVRDFIYVTDPVYPVDEPDRSVDETPYEEPPYDEPEPELTLEDAAPIELNSADIELLMLLPYVDEFIAGKIIELREDIQRFSHPYELLYVEELTREQVAEIIEYVYVENVEEAHEQLNDTYPEYDGIQ